jgi:hypothetical protein
MLNKNKYLLNHLIKETEIICEDRNICRCQMRKLIIREHKLQFKRKAMLDITLIRLLILVYV